MTTKGFIMRSYLQNSPEAAGRIVALTLLADGYAGQAELERLDRLGAAEALGLSRAGLHGVVHAFCEDLLVTHHEPWIEASRVDERSLSAILAEVTDPALRSKVLQLCVEVAEADAQIAQGEAAVLTAAVMAWGLPAAEEAFCQAPTAPVN